MLISFDISANCSNISNNDFADMQLTLTKFETNRIWKKSNINKFKNDYLCIQFDSIISIIIGKFE